MFAPFARNMAARLSGLTSGHLLELAAGTGAVTRTLAATLPPGVRLGRGGGEADEAVVGFDRHRVWRTA